MRSWNFTNAERYRADQAADAWGKALKPSSSDT